MSVLGFIKKQFVFCGAAFAALITCFFNYIFVFGGSHPLERSKKAIFIYEIYL